MSGDHPDPWSFRGMSGNPWWFSGTLEAMSGDPWPFSGTSVDPRPFSGTLEDPWFSGTSGDPWLFCGTIGDPTRSFWEQIGLFGDFSGVDDFSIFSILVHFPLPIGELGLIEQSICDMGLQIQHLV